MLISITSSRRFIRFQNKVEDVFVEGTGGWMVPIHRNYFVSDLAVAIKLPVAVIPCNRLGCLNHALLTVQSILGHGLRCLGLVMNTLKKLTT